MSMHRYANGGPIMAGLAAMSEGWGGLTKSAMDAAIEPMPAKAEPFSADELYHMMEGLSEQIGELAAHISEIGQRLASVENATMPQDMDAVLKRVKPIACVENEGDIWIPWDGQGMVYAALFDDGSIFHRVRGWQSGALSALVVEQIKADLDDAGYNALYAQQAYRQMVDNAYAAGVGQQGDIYNQLQVQQAAMQQAAIIPQRWASYEPASANEAAILEFNRRNVLAD